MIRGFFSVYRGLRWATRGIRTGNHVLTGVGALLAWFAFSRSRATHAKPIYTKVLEPGESITMKVVRGRSVTQHTTTR